jgi:hypothetical protein
MACRILAHKKVTLSMMWQDWFLWFIVFVGTNYLTLQYYVNWKSILPFTGTPGDYTLLVGIALFARFVFLHGTARTYALYRRFKWPMLLLVALVAFSFGRSLSQQSLGLSLLSHRGWAYLVFLVAGYQLVDGRFTMSHFVRNLSTLSVVAGIVAMLYAFTFEPGSLARYYPQVVPFSGVFIIYHAIRVFRDRVARDKWLLLFHFFVVVLSQTRSLWISTLIGIVIAAIYLRERIHLRRILGQITVTAAIVATIHFAGVFETAEKAIVGRLAVGKDDIAQETGSYALRVFAFLDVWDYLEESGPMAQLIGISDLHWKSPQMQTLIGYGRVMGYAGVVYRDLGVEETAYLENSIATLLLAFGILGSCVLWFGVFYPLAMTLLLHVKTLDKNDPTASAFLLAFSAAMMGQPAQYFFGVEFKGFDLGILLIVLGVTVKTIDNEVFQRNDSAGEVSNRVVARR